MSQRAFLTAPLACPRESGHTDFAYHEAKRGSWQGALADSFSNRGLIREHVNNVFSPDPALLTVSDVHYRKSKGRGFGQSTGGIAHHHWKVLQAAQVAPVAKMGYPFESSGICGAYLPDTGIDHFAIGVRIRHGEYCVDTGLLYCGHQRRTSDSAFLSPESQDDRSQGRWAR